MSNHGPLILLVEDEPQIRRFLRAALANHDYRLIEAESGQAGIDQVLQQRPDLIILDLGLPDIDGLEVTRRVREWSLTPILVLSARGQEQDKVAALDAGADDYLTKPFGVAELLARLRVALRHAQQSDGTTATPVFTTGPLRIDLVRQQVFVDEQEVHLTPIEYKLLATLVRHAGKVLTHRHLLREVWGPAYATESQYLRVYMGQLRHKLEENPARPRFLRTEPGVGYRLLPDVQ
jgi:two-component system, OmpR family, KDP operon response regulator KdpE